MGEFGAELGVGEIRVLSAEGGKFPAAGLAAELNAEVRAPGGAHRPPRFDLERVRAVVLAVGGEGRVAIERAGGHRGE